MTVQNPAPSKSLSWQINIAAEGIAAAQFARCGFDVSVQYGADKPAYDLVVTKADSLLKVSVKGSHDGVWNLTQSYIRRAAELSGKKADYYGAIDLWLDHHAPRTICCLVQFYAVEINQLPRIYLATPKEVAARLRETAEGRGDSVLYEGLHWDNIQDPRGIDPLPTRWRFSPERIQELLMPQTAAQPKQASKAASQSGAPSWTGNGLLSADGAGAVASA